MEECYIKLSHNIILIGDNMKKEAVIFLAWGEKYLQEVESCINFSSEIQKYDIYIITDKDTQVKSNSLKVIRAAFKTNNLLRKTELIDYLPANYNTYLFLDSDTRVIGDISLGFEKADKYDIALSPAPHYSLDCFWGFDNIMKMEGINCKGQLQYNTGVIFFKKSPVITSIFTRWKYLALKYQDIFTNDQPFLTLALEQLDINPYTLSISYNYRGFGDAISGKVRIWHSHEKMPDNINVFKKMWPPRRAYPGKVIFPDDDTDAPI